MNAGRELDELVAEKVMGLVPGVDYGTFPAHEWEEDFESEDYKTFCRRCNGIVAWHEEPDTGACCKVPFPYSTAIYRAWEVVEKLADAVGEYGNKHGFKIRRDSATEWHCDIGLGCVNADSAPLAICLAALNAVSDRPVTG